MSRWQPTGKTSETDSAESSALQAAAASGSAVAVSATVSQLRQSGKKGKGKEKRTLNSKQWVGSNSHESDQSIPEDPLWYFAFDWNLSPEKLREKRGIMPLEEVAGKLPGWSLTFNHKGGRANIEPLTALEINVPYCVHGLLRLIKPGDLKRLQQMEKEYSTVEVDVEAYDGRSLKAVALISPPEYKLSASVAPPEGYLKLIREGCASLGIDPGYRDWLNTLPSTTQRGPEHWQVPADIDKMSKKKPPNPTEVSNKDGEDGGRLRLNALAEFAVQGDAPLVDIGANLGKCSPPDIAAQLVRAAAAKVSCVILTGCSVKGSGDAQRLCNEWNGEKGLQNAKRCLGASASSEIHAFGIKQLPRLVFTAGVHPHDAKSCNDQTLNTLRSLTEDPNCVAVGECGLDYDRMFSPREVQLEWCRKQVELAVELGKPLFLHERDKDANKGAPLGSASDLQKILMESNVKPSDACIHCFTGSAKELKEYVSRGFQIGLTGFAAMQKRGAHIRQFLQDGVLPISQLMIETDCPFMMPDKAYLPQKIGIQGRKNEPCCMPAVCRAVAECLGLPEEEVANTTTLNSTRFFKL